MNFDWITDELAVGGGFEPPVVPALARVHGVGAIIDLREEDRDDEVLLIRHGMLFLHLPTPDTCAIRDSHLDEGVAFARAVREEGRRLLVHCQHGIGRSATLALCIMADRGDDPLASLKTMKSARALVSPSPEQFQCWAAWLRGRGFEPPAWDDFVKVAYAQSGWT